MCDVSPLRHMSTPGALNERKRILASHRLAAELAASKQEVNHRLSHLLLLPSRTEGDAEHQAEGGPGPPTGPQASSISLSCCPSLLPEASLQIPPNLSAPACPALLTPFLALAEAERRSLSPHRVREHQRDQLHFIPACAWGLLQFQL